MNLLLVEPAELGPDNVAFVEGVRARHLRQVLRAEPGRPVRVGLIDGPMGTGTVLSVDDDHARLACTFETTTPPVPPIDLLLALPRPKVLRRMWAQLAALGVGRIVLTNAARVERNYFDATVLDPAVYRPLLIEGLQQARDTRVPVVTVHRQFRILVEDHLDQLCPQPMRLLADPGETDVSTADVRADTGVGPYGDATGVSPLGTNPGRHEAGPHPPVPGTPPHPSAVEAGHRSPAVGAGHRSPAVGAGPHPPGVGAGHRSPAVGAGPRARPTQHRILLAIGPEGGWNNFERRLLEAHGFRRFSLGQRTLRTDTACIALHAVATSVTTLPST